MVLNRRNSMAMAGLIDKDNADNLQVSKFSCFFCCYGLLGEGLECTTGNTLL